MKNPLFSALGVAALLAFSQAAGAQASSTATTPLPTQVTVSVNYVTTSFASFLNESSRIAPGKDHDALLLAALLKNGAQDTQSPQITTTAGVSGRISIVTQMPSPLPSLTSFIQVKPRINKNGLITVMMTNHLESASAVLPPGALLPSTETTDVTETDTFVDGQTLMVNSMSSGKGPDATTPPLLLIFAKVKMDTATLHSPAAAQPVKQP